MRQLFLPACLCLVTWSGPTNSDPRLSLDDFTGSQAAKVYSQTRMASLETSGRDIDEPAPRKTPSAEIAIPLAAEPAVIAKIPAPHVDPSLEEIAALVPNLASEQPVPSGVVINNGEPIGIPLPPIPKPVIARSEDEICGTLKQAAEHNDVPAPFLIRLLFQESRFEPGAVSPVGAQGIAQFMPATADSMGLANPFDPVQAIPASARLLKELIGQFGNLGLAAAAYNAGPKRISDWLAAKGKSKLPEETQGYVKIITGKPVENWSSAEARHPPQKVPQRAPCQEVAGLLAWNGPDAVPLPVASPQRVVVKLASVKTDTTKATTKVASAKPVEAKAADKQVAAATPAPASKPETKAAAKTQDKKTADNAGTKTDIKIVRGNARVSAVIQIVKPEPVRAPAPKREKLAQR